MKKKDSNNSTSPSLIRELCDQYKRDFDTIEYIRNTWDEKEAMLLGVPVDSQSKVTKSQVFDPRLSTIVFERAARVAAQTPTGKVQAMTKKDVSKSMMMNLVLEKYVMPNALTQYDILTKTRLWDVYSNVYGTFGVLVDYMVRDDYVGPDFTLIPIRNVIPQSGRSTNPDYVFVRSVVSKKWLLGRDTKNWKNIDKLLEMSRRNPIQDTDYQSFIETEFNTQDFVNAEKDDFEQIEIITRYEPDRWVTFSKDAKLILRDIKNPQQNNKIPVVFKHAFPLLDRFFGLGEFERGQSLQMSINSLINLYLDGVKMSIFPPLKINLQDVVAKTLKYEPAAKWILKTQNPDAITQMQFSPQGINTFQNTYQFLLAALQNQSGTTDTTVPQEADITAGKTPQALKIQQSRENARDSWDRFMLEKALEQTFDRFVDLIATRQEKPIKINLMEEDLALINQINPDLADMYESGKAGEVLVKPQDIKETQYKYYIDSGTTMKKDDMDQNEALSGILNLLLKIPGAMEQASAQGFVQMGDKKLDLGEAIKRWILTSGVGDPEKIVSDLTPEDQQAMAMQKQQEQEAMMQQQQAMQQQQMAQEQQMMQQQQQMQGQPQQGPQANFEDPQMAQLLAEFQGQGQQVDPTQQIMDELSQI